MEKNKKEPWKNKKEHLRMAQRWGVVPVVIAAAWAAACGVATAAQYTGSCAAPTPRLLRLRGGFDVAAAHADYVREVMEVADPAHACARTQRMRRRPRVAGT